MSHTTWTHFIRKTTGKCYLICSKRLNTNKVVPEHRSWTRRGDEGEGWDYLRLHGPVHGLRGGAAVGEGFGGSGWQRGLLGRRGGLRGALDVFTVALIRLG